MHCLLILLLVAVVSVSGDPNPEHEALRDLLSKFAYHPIHGFQVKKNIPTELKRYFGNLLTYVERAQTLNNVMKNEMKVVKDLEQLIMFGTVESYKHKAISSSIITLYTYQWLTQRIHLFKYDAMFKQLESIQQDLFHAKNGLENTVNDINKYMKERYQLSDEDKTTNNINLKGVLNYKLFVTQTDDAVKKIKAVIKSL